MHRLSIVSYASRVFFRLEVSSHLITPCTMIIDFHTHVFPPSLINHRSRYTARDATLHALFANPQAPMATAEELLAAMDEAAVDVAVILGIGWTSQDVAKEVNDYLLEAAARHPQRLVPFCSVNPAWGDEALREVERCARQGARGVGELHPDTQGFRLSDRRVMEPFINIVRSYHLILLTHASEPVGHQYPGKGKTTPAALMDLIKQSPGVPIVCAHWGGGLPFFNLMPEVRDLLGNTYFDTAASPLLYDPQVFSVVARLASPTSILLGSDFPLLKPQRLIEQLDTAPLGNKKRQAILGTNAERLLGLTGNHGVPKIR